MWIILNDGALEITATDANKSSNLFVSGRGALQRLFPDVEIASVTDMHFYESTIIDRDRVAETVANEIRAVAYESFEPDPSDLDPNAGVLPSLGTPMPPGHFAVDSDGPPAVERFDGSVFLTIPAPYGAVTVTMTANHARLLAEQLEKQLKGAN